VTIVLDEEANYILRWRSHAEYESNGHGDRPRPRNVMKVVAADTMRRKFEEALDSDSGDELDVAEDGVLSW